MCFVFHGAGLKFHAEVMSVEVTSCLFPRRLPSSLSPAPGHLTTALFAGLAGVAVLLGF